MSGQGENDANDGVDSPAAPGQFLPTRWSLVSAVRRDDPARAEAALEELCGRYWFPLYGYVRRTGRSREQAEDLTQGFFAQVLRLETFSRADAGKGKLRSFLIKALKNFIVNQHRRDSAAKRGGGQSAISLDLDWAEDQFKIEPADPAADPERQFERRWAMTVIKSVLAQLGDEYRERGRGDLHRALEPFITGDSSDTYEDAASEVGMSAGAVKVAAHRMRKRFKELFRNEIADTLAEGEDVDAELREMMAALG